VKNEPETTPLRVWTVGHSTLPGEEFALLLEAHGIEQLADVRRFPISRRHPQFNRDALATRLAQNGIAYLHLPELGGRREPQPDSANTAWRDAGFRGYADYMQTAAFAEGTARLIEAAQTKRTAIMCAERTWQSCHRGLIADHLKVCGAEVNHILDAQHTELHPYTSVARLLEGSLSYALPQTDQQQLPF
jgi:uncharacterized protein (DUF488 family)